MKTKKSSIQRIDQFFLRMAAIYPYKWAGQFPDAKALLIAKSEWADALNEFSDHEIKQGLAHCRRHGSEFPPSIPQFIRYCLPTLDDLQLPSPDAAYQLAIHSQANGQWENDLIYNAVALIGFYEFRMNPAYKVKPEFIKCYKKLCEHALHQEIMKRRTFALAQQTARIEHE